MNKFLIFLHIFLNLFINSWKNSKLKIYVIFPIRVCNISIKNLKIKSDNTKKLIKVWLNLKFSFVINIYNINILKTFCKLFKNEPNFISKINLKIFLIN